MSKPPPEISGKTVVIVLLSVGLIGGFALSRVMPRRNPKEADPGSPYYSPPDDHDIDEMRKQMKQK